MNFLYIYIVSTYTLSGTRRIQFLGRANVPHYYDLNMKVQLMENFCQTSCFKFWFKTFVTSSIETDIVAENSMYDMSSDLGRDCLHFTSPYDPW